MLKRILFCGLYIIIFLITWKQDSNAKIWENCKVPADSIIAAINRGDTVTINGCEIVGTLSITGTPQKRFIIKSPITGFGNVFDDSVFFYSCDFLSEIDFLGASFLKYTGFSGVNFRKGVYYRGCDFDDRTYFLLCKFKMGAYFEGSTFNKFSSFAADTFLDTASFLQDTFRGIVSFTDAHFLKGVTFAGVDFGENAAFVRTQFDGKVNLTSTHFDKIIILWKQIEGRLVCDNLTSFKLMRYFDDQRMLDGVDGVYFFLKDQERVGKPWYYRYPEFWFIQLTCGYGVKPGYTFLWSACIILLFTVFYTLRYNSIKEIENKFLYSKRPRVLRKVRRSFTKRLYDAFYFSATTFIIGIVSDWHPTDEFLIKSKRFRLIKFRTLSMIEGILGWVLLVLFVVTLTRKFIR